MVPFSYTFLAISGSPPGGSDQWPLADPGPPTVARVSGGARPHGVGVVDHGPGLRLGPRWFLGPVFHYRGPGFWFGLPLGSQAGFTLTAAVLLAILTFMTRGEPNRRIDRWMDHPHLTSLVTYNAQILWLAVVAVVWLPTSSPGRPSSSGCRPWRRPWCCGSSSAAPRRLRPGGARSAGRFGATDQPDRPKVRVTDHALQVPFGDPAFFAGDPDPEFAELRRGCPSVGSRSRICGR